MLVVGGWFAKYCCWWPERQANTARVTAAGVEPSVDLLKVSTDLGRIHRTLFPNAASFND
jgi:hypothetical protein